MAAKCYITVLSQRGTGHKLFCPGIAHEDGRERVKLVGGTTRHRADAMREAKRLAQIVGLTYKDS